VVLLNGRLSGPVGYRLILGLERNVASVFGEWASEMRSEREKATSLQLLLVRYGMGLTPAGVWAQLGDEKGFVVWEGEKAILASEIWVNGKVVLALVLERAVWDLLVAKGQELESLLDGHLAELWFLRRGRQRDGR